MKKLKYFSFLFIMCLLWGYGIKNNIDKNSKNTMPDNASLIENNNTATKESTKISLEPVTCDTEQITAANNYSVLADSRDGNILLFDIVTEKELASFEESYSSGSLFLSMTDKNNGFLLYCSSPACGQMMKQLYITKDRWQTYRKMDISSLIDGYPTSLLAQSDKHLYIGAQLRSDGYLFETIDGGKTWHPVIIDTAIEKCRYGYAPVNNSEKSVSCVLLECNGFYSLYQSKDALSTWEQIGNFSLEMELDSYFIWEDKVIITDMQGEHYRLVL